MQRIWLHRRLLLLCALGFWVSQGAQAQPMTDLSGEWMDIGYEEGDRGGPSGARGLGFRNFGGFGGGGSPISEAALGNYTGIPLNDAGRQRALSFDASIIAHPAVMLRPHPIPYSTRGFVRFFRIEKVVEERTQQLIAYRVVGGWNWAPRMIWLDGRPHPPDYAEHQYIGFSTGRWERGMLVVTTTHLKEAFHRRNGVPVSTDARLTEYFIRHGDRLIHVQFTEDPHYLEEPFIRTTDFVSTRELHAQTVNYVWDIAEEASDWSKDYVPHFPLGTRHTEFADLLGIPYEEVALGGAAHTYPAFRTRLKELMRE